MSIKNIDDFEAVFWDFDGVILNSNSIRDNGFLDVLKEFPTDQVERLMQFHQSNGGLSRYVKFRYFFEEIRGEIISNAEVTHWANRFSEIMRELLVNEKLLIGETLACIRKYHTKIPMHIVSGSDQEELRYLCSAMHINKYFKSINGSPKPKIKWVKDLMVQYEYNAKNCVLIGDSKNDFDAAKSNGLSFFGINNKEVEKLSTIKLNLF